MVPSVMSSAAFTYFPFFIPSMEPMLASTRQITQKSTLVWVIGMMYGPSARRMS